MKNTILILLLFVATSGFTYPPDTLMRRSIDYYEIDLNAKRQTEMKASSISMIVGGLIFAGIGVYREINRSPYPNHPTSINYNPNASRPLNYLLIGSGAALTGLGVKMLITF
jgi:hypothetical protein